MTKLGRQWGEDSYVPGVPAGNVTSTGRLATCSIHVDPNHGIYSSTCGIVRNQQTLPSTSATVQMSVLHRVLLVSFVGISSLASAQTSSFVTTLGRDTLAFEQYRRAGDTITGDWVTLYGGIMYHHYTIVLEPDGRVARYTLSLHRVSGKPEGTVDLRLGNDSVVAVTPGGDTQRVALRADAPVFARTMSLLETVTRRARRLGGDSVVVPVVGAFGPYRHSGFRVMFFGGDSARLGDLYAQIDGDGRLLGVSGRATTDRMETVRAPDFDLRAVAAHFPNVTDDTPIAGVPALSPRDTVRALVGRARITVDYGRPAVRGRAVFSRGVLGDTVWRLGANAATQFTTTTDLVVNGKRLPAGTYSLWVRVSPDNSSYALVFNSQSGQWGTEHHADRDLVSVPLTVRQLPSNQERLAISVDGDGDDGAIFRARWAQLELSARLEVASL
jgi:DUF2911 family protein